MTTPKTGGRYKRLPGGQVVPADQAPTLAAPPKTTRKKKSEPTPLADTVLDASGDNTVNASTTKTAGGN